MESDNTLWPMRGDPDCSFCLGDGLKEDGESECPCVHDNGRVGRKNNHMCLVASACSTDFESRLSDRYL